MKIKIKLSRVEMQGFGALVRNCCGAIAGEDFPAVQHRDALVGLTLKLAGKMPTLRGTNRMTLTEMESLALYEVAGDLVGCMGPLEMTVGLKVLGEIDVQRAACVGLMRGNVSGQMGRGC